METPPSPPAARRRHKKTRSKQLDPFLQLGHPADQAIVQVPPLTPPDKTEDSDEPLYKRIILTPFLFTSFLISLFLVDTQNAISRTRDSTLFSLLSPEPYQDPSDSRWDRRDSTTPYRPLDVINPDQRLDKEKRKRKSWHLHRKITKIARLEINDAFEMRGKVMVAMGVSIAMVIYGSWCLLGWMVDML